MVVKVSRYVAVSAGLVGGDWPSLTVTSHANAVLVEGEPMHMDQLSRHIWRLAYGTGLSGKQVHTLQNAALAIMEQVIKARSPQGVIW